MKEYGIILEPQFFEELDAILYSFPKAYISKKKLYGEVRNTVMSLSILPERYSRINNNCQTENIRKLLINKFVVIYEVDSKNSEVYILHIFSQKQDYLNQI